MLFQRKWVYMKTFYIKIKKRYFDNDDFRLQIFNLFAFAGICISLIMTIHALVMQTGLLDTIIKAFSGVFTLFMVLLIEKTKRYQLVYSITIFIVFILFFTAMFFTGGGYYGGITSFFVFAVVFTTCMIDGKAMFFMVILELLLYTSLCVVDYLYLDLTSLFESEFDYFSSILVCLLASSLAVGVTTYRQVKLYKTQQAKLDEKNMLLAQISKSKTEFLANTSHEMRTPLTVISINIQTVTRLLNYAQETSENTEMSELLTDAQEEIMRLSRIVGGMLSLNAMSEQDERHRVDFSALLLNTTDMLKLVFSKNNNNIILEQREKLTAFCDADLMSQVLINILQNANHHTTNDTIRISAFAEKGMINVQIKDNGCGISSEILPKVFERGVSNGGTGFGLYLCKTVINSHGGNIWIESEENKGCAVYITLPIYQGQFEQNEENNT